MEEAPAGEPLVGDPGAEAPVEPGEVPPSKPPVELYLVRLSAPCRAVWLYLLQHDIPHVLVDVDFSIDDQVVDWIRQFPHKEVPILVDGKVTVFGGQAILRYLAGAYTQWAGFGLGASCRALVESLVSWADSEIHRVAGYCYAYPNFLEKYRLPNEAANEVLVESGIKQLTKYLERLENDYLMKRMYLAGDRLTVADTHVATTLMQAEWTGFRFRMWPRVEAWLRRCRAQEYWAEVHAAHTKLVSEIELAPYDF